MSPEREGQALPVVSGAAAIEVPAGSELHPARWLLRPPRLGRMDRLCQLALAAADAALVDAQANPSSWAGERVAVLFGTAHGCHATNEEYYRGLLAEGARSVSPRLFAYTLPSSPVGEITIHYGARGPAETFASGCTAGLGALAAAARLCAVGKCDMALAVAADVGGGTLPGLGLRARDAAAALVVERAESLGHRQERVRARWLGAGEAYSSGRPEEALERALGHALAADGPGRRVDDGAWLYLPPLDNPPFDDAVAPLDALVRWLAVDPGRADSRAKVTAVDHSGAALVAFLERTSN